MTFILSHFEAVILKAVVINNSVVIILTNIYIVFFCVYLSVPPAQCSDCRYYAVYVNQQYKEGFGGLECIKNPSSEDVMPCYTECAVSRSQDICEPYA